MKPNQTIKMILFTIIISITVVILTLSFISCGAGVNIGSADKTLSSFSIEWEGDFNSHCYIGVATDIVVKALDQDNEVFDWSGTVFISTPNNDVTMNISQVELLNGSGSANLECQLLTGETEEVDIVLTNGSITTTFEQAITLYPLIEWQTMLGGSGTEFGRSMQQTSDSGYIVVGQSISSTVAGPDLLQSNQGDYDLYIVKLDSNGAISWQTMLGGSEYDIGYSIQQTSDSSYIVAGMSYSSTVEGPDLLQSHQGNSDCYIVKLDSDGEISWQTMLGGSGIDIGRSIQQTSDSGYIVAGWSSSSTVAGLDLLQSHQGNSDYYIVKLDSNGEISWQTMLGGSDLEEGHSIQQTSDNGYIVAGRSESSTVAGLDLLQSHQGGDDYYVVKLDSNGAISWQTMLGGSGLDEEYSIQQTGDTGYIVAGGSESSTVVGPDLLQSHQGDDDYYIVKLDSNGAISWQTMLGGSGGDIGYSIQQTNDNGYILGGNSASSTVVGPDLLQSQQGNDDYYIVKLDSNGAISWQKMLGGSGYDFAYSIQQTSDNGYIVAGASESSTVAGPNLLQTNQGSYDYYVVKLYPYVLLN
jgi:hypothetical protein